MNREPLEEPAADAAVLELVCDGECDLGARWIAQPDVGPDRDDPLDARVAGHLPDKRQRLGAVAAEERRNEMLVHSHSSLKSQIQGLR